MFLFHSWFFISSDLGDGVIMGVDTQEQENYIDEGIWLINLHYCIERRYISTRKKRQNYFINK